MHELWPKFIWPINICLIKLRNNVFIGFSSVLLWIPFVLKSYGSATLHQRENFEGDPRTKYAILTLRAESHSSDRAIVR